MRKLLGGLFLAFMLYAALHYSQTHRFGVSEANVRSDAAHR